MHIVIPATEFTQSYSTRLDLKHYLLQFLIIAQYGLEYSELKTPSDAG